MDWQERRIYRHACWFARCALAHGHQYSRETWIWVWTVHRSSIDTIETRDRTKQWFRRHLMTLVRYDRRVPMDPGDGR